MKLMIEVELGNNSMQSAHDVAGAVYGSLFRYASSMLQPLTEQDVGTIRDANGNTVGMWQVVA